MRAKEQLDMAIARTDRSINNLHIWPGTNDSPEMFRARYMFQAILDQHRSTIKIGMYFWDEIQYYTNIIDTLFGWVTRDVDLKNDSSLWRWLMAYSYLLGSINHLGTEQALCSVFFSIICFSHKETFYYANASFSGEAAFRMYRQAFPTERETPAWRTKDHAQFFPDLASCRREIYADMDYQGISIDPSVCDYSRKNETKFSDLSILTITEFEGIRGSILNHLSLSENKDSMFLIISTGLLGILGGYFIFVHLLRCACIRCSHMRKRTKRKTRDSTDGVTWQSRDDFFDDEKLDELSSNHRMITYTPDCHPISPAHPLTPANSHALSPVNSHRHSHIPPPPASTHVSACNCHNSITVKVATV